MFSDDFGDGVLDARWVEADPGNDTTWTESGGVVTAASADFDDAYSGAAQNPRLLQAHDDGDFDVAVRWAKPSSTALGVGLWVDDGTDQEYLRWDVRTNLRDTFISYRVGGSRTIIENGSLGQGAEFRWLRLTKVGTTYTCWTRAADDDTGPWVQRQQFVSAVNALRVGLQVVASNASGSAACAEFVDLLAGTEPEPAAGTFTGTLTRGGTATGARPSTATFTGGHGRAATSAGRRTSAGAFAGTLARAGTALARRASAGLFTGTHARTGGFTGTTPDTETAAGSFTGVLARTGGFTGHRPSRGTATGILARDGHATGARTSAGAFTGLLSRTGASEGYRAARGLFAGVLTRLGGFVGRDPSAPSLRLTARRLDTDLTATRQATGLTARRTSHDLTTRRLP